MQKARLVRLLIFRGVALLVIATLVWAGTVRSVGIQRNVVGDCIEFCVVYSSPPGDNWAETREPELCDENGDPIPDDYPDPPGPPGYRGPPYHEVTPVNESDPHPRTTTLPDGGTLAEYCWLLCADPPLASGEYLEVNVQYEGLQGETIDRKIRYTRQP